MSFKEYLTEKLMTFGRKNYPKFGQIVIIGGGAGSGKGFQLSTLLGVEGKVFDVDALKKLSLKAPKLAERIKAETGQDIKHFDLRNAQNVFKLHEILADIYNIPNKHQAAAFASIVASPADRKPNLIFDVTLKGLDKLASIAMHAEALGYDKKNIHLVWVVNDINTAKVQNLTRDRVVPEEILVNTHEGAAITFKKILDMGDQLQKYMDGDIYFSFNNAGVDTQVQKSNIIPADKGSYRLGQVANKNRTGHGSWVKNADYIKVKNQGQKQKSSSELSKEVLDKIREYTPQINHW